MATKTPIKVSNTLANTYKTVSPVGIDKVIINIAETPPITPALIKVFTQTENSRQSTNLQSLPAKKTKDQKNNKNSDTRLKGSQA